MPPVLQETEPATIALELDWLIDLGVLEPNGQLSVTVGKGNVTIAPHWLASLLFTILAGQVIVGACVSLTVTVNVQVEPEADVTVTGVVPFGKKEPDAGELVTTPQPPVEVGVKFTIAPH